MTKDENDKLEALLKKDPTMGRGRLARAAGISINRVQHWLKVRKTGKLVLKAEGPAVLTAPSKGVSVKDFLARLDYPAILRSTIKAHCRSDFLQESDLRILSKMSTTNFRAAVNSGHFEANMLKIDGVVWWSCENNVEAAKAKKGMV